MAAALLAGVAALVTLSAVARDRVPPPGTPTVVAARTVATGAALTGTDVEVVMVPASLRPERAFAASDAVVGQVLSSALEAGEILTPARLLER